MATTLKSHIGPISILEENPRKMRDGQFSALVESLERDPEFLMARGIVVWQVPTDLHLPEGEKSPFEKQLGKIVCLGGNMRLMAFRALGYDEVRPEWIIEAKDGNGVWWTREKAERFVLIDNSQEGNSGENDYQKLIEHFEERILREGGIDFSNFQAMVAAGTISPLTGEDEEGDDEADRAEKDDQMGEKSEELQSFIAEREKTRAALKEVCEFGFYLVLVFEGGLAEKAEFVSKAKAFGGTVMVDGGPYLVLVFESYAQKAEFLDRSGLRDLKTADGIPALIFGMYCDGRAFAKRMGIELAETGLHNRKRKVDGQLAEMAEEPQVQKTEEQIETEIYERLKSERESLGMETGRKKKGSR